MAESTTGKLTIVGLFLFLRTQFLLAREQKNKDVIDVMFGTFYHIWEASEDFQDGHDITVWLLAEEFVCCARDSLYGVEWKGKVPSEEQIEQIESNPKRSCKLTMVGLFIFLRKRCLIARDTKDEGELSRLMQTFHYLKDAASSVADKDVVDLATPFTQSGMARAESKSHIPTEEDIHHLLPNHD